MKQKRDIQIKSSKTSFEYFSPEHKNADKIQHPKLKIIKSQILLS